MVGLAHYTDNLSPKKRSITAILALYLGWLGVHRLYIGKTKSALLMFSLSQGVILLGLWGIRAPLSFTIVGLWVLWDFVIVVSGRARDAKGRSIKKW